MRFRFKRKCPNRQPCWLSTIRSKFPDLSLCQTPEPAIAWLKGVANQSMIYNALVWFLYHDNSGAVGHPGIEVNNILIEQTHATT